MGYFWSSHSANKIPASSRFLGHKCRYQGFKCIYEYLVYRYVQLNINRKIYPTNGTRNELRQSAIAVSHVTRFNTALPVASALPKFRHKAATQSINNQSIRHTCRQSLHRILCLGFVSMALTCDIYYCQKCFRSWNSYFHVVRLRATGLCHKVYLCRNLRLF